jgi:hypothetical protein
MILHAKLIENDQIVTLHIDGENISRTKPFNKGSGLKKRIPNPPEARECLLQAFTPN